MDNDIFVEPLERGVDRAGPAADESSSAAAPALPWPWDSTTDWDDEEGCRLQFLMELDATDVPYLIDEYSW